MGVWPLAQSGRTSQIFVGRQRELAALTAPMDDALEGRGQIVMLAGEPGIGKTRTAQELASYAESAVNRTEAASYANQHGLVTADPAQ
jgi:MoxR-like ATPase